MLSDAAPTPASDLARNFLRLANEEYQIRLRNRGYFARIAKDHGLTNQDIADAYGMTEAAVRALIKRTAK
jgi:hypothetical protein